MRSLRHPPFPPVRTCLAIRSLGAFFANLSRPVSRYAFACGASKKQM
jgi:hypothetical protein